MSEQILSYRKSLNFYLGLSFTLLITGCSWSGAPFTPSGPTNVRGNNSASVQKATMRPYTINGKTYYPSVVTVGDKASGTASSYGPYFHGKTTSNGEVYNMYNMTAAHKTLPMNTILKVTNLRNQKSVIVRVNDRGPFVADRVLDLSKAAAMKLDVIGTGTAPVSMEVIGFNEDINAVTTASTQPTKPTSTGIKVPNPVSPTAPVGGIVISSEQRVVGGDFMVQIGSFKNLEGANRYQREHKSIDGYRSVVKTFTIDGSTIYRVFLNGFRSEDEARDYARSGKFQGAFIVRG